MTLVVEPVTPTVKSLQALLEGLYAKQLNLAPDYARPYLAEHSSPRCITNPDVS